MTIDITCILAVAPNGCIGRNGTLPWRLPSDMKHFRASTLDKHLLMGRKTFESIPVGMMRRVVYVLTTDVDYKPMHRAIRVGSVNEAIEKASEAGQKELIVCGGASLYQRMFSAASTLLVTHVSYEGEGDTFVQLPSTLNDPTQWEKTTLSQGNENGVAFEIASYRRA